MADYAVAPRTMVGDYRAYRKLQAKLKSLKKAEEDLKERLKAAIGDGTWRVDNELVFLQHIVKQAYTVPGFNYDQIKSKPVSDDDTEF